VNSEAFDFLRRRKRKHFSKTWVRDVKAKAGSGGSILKKEAGSGNKLRSD